ncbi:hypothetical protein ACGC1H_007600 [Rhizoctonia solani]
MGRLARVNDILNSEELAACRAYYSHIICSNNVSDDMVEPACFRVWLRLIVRTLEAEPFTSEKAAEVSSSLTRSSTATVSITAPTARPESFRSPVTTPPSTTPFAEAPIVETAGASANVAPGSASGISVPTPPTEPSTTKNTTDLETPAPKPPTTVAPTQPAEAPTKSQNIAPPSAKATTRASSPAIESISTSRPSAVAPNQSNAENRQSPVVAQQIPAPTIVPANRSGSMPKSTTSTADNSSSAATAQVTTTSSTVNNVALQSAPAQTVAQTAARPTLSLPPVIPAFGTSSMVAPTSRYPSRTTTASVVSHPVASPAVSQHPSVKASTAIIPSVQESTLRAPHLEHSALPGLPPSTQVALASRYEAQGEPKILVYKCFYEALLRFHAQHRNCSLRSSPSSQPTCQTPTVSQKGEDKTDPPAETSNKRQYDDANGKSN